VELDAGAKLDATECSKGTGAELDSGTDLSSGRSKRMEHNHDRSARVRMAGGRRRRVAQAESVPRAGAAEWSPCRDGGQCGRGRSRRVESSREQRRAMQSGCTMQTRSVNKWMRLGP
jgi:hypothetical protein